jgi:enterochelin esterase-like enzyme
MLAFIRQKPGISIGSMISRCLIAILLVSMAGASCAHAQDAAQQIVIGERSAMHSKVMDEERRYLVYLPPSYQTAEGAKRRYPVIYLLDGGAQFHATAGIVHHLSSYSSGVQRMPESLIVKQGQGIWR